MDRGIGKQVSPSINARQLTPQDENQAQATDHTKDASPKPVINTRSSASVSQAPSALQTSGRQADAAPAVSGSEPTLSADSRRQRFYQRHGLEQVDKPARFKLDINKSTLEGVAKHIRSLPHAAIHLNFEIDENSDFRKNRQVIVRTFQKICDELKNNPQVKHLSVTFGSRVGLPVTPLLTALRDMKQLQSLTLHCMAGAEEQDMKLLGDALASLPALARLDVADRGLGYYSSENPNIALLNGVLIRALQENPSIRSLEAPATDSLGSLIRSVAGLSPCALQRFDMSNIWIRKELKEPLIALLESQTKLIDLGDMRAGDKDALEAIKAASPMGKAKAAAALDLLIGDGSSNEALPHLPWDVRTVMVENMSPELREQLGRALDKGF